MKVAKFGGSSVANAKQIKKVANIIKSDSSRKVIVVSAPGKRFSDDVKMTDLLIELCYAKQQNQDHDLQLQNIMVRFQEIIEDLGLDQSILEDIQQTIEKYLQFDISPMAQLDALKSIGEDSSAKIVSAYLKHLGLNASYVNPKEAGILSVMNLEMLNYCRKAFLEFINSENAKVYLSSPDSLVIPKIMI